jgi:hypothetical protein
MSRPQLVTRWRSGALQLSRPPVEVIKRLFSRFPGEAQKLAEIPGFDAPNFANLGPDTSRQRRRSNAFGALVRASAKIRELTRAFSFENQLDRSLEQER